MEKSIIYVSDAGLFHNPFFKRRIMKKNTRTSYFVRCAEGLKNALILNEKLRINE